MSELLDIITDVAAEAYGIAREKGVDIEPVDALRATLAHRQNKQVERRVEKMPEPYKQWMRDFLLNQGLGPEVLESSEDGRSLLCALEEMTRFKIEYPASIDLTE